MMSKLEILRAAKCGAIETALKIAESIHYLHISDMCKRARELVDTCEKVEWLEEEINSELDRLESCE